MDYYDWKLQERRYGFAVCYYDSVYLRCPVQCLCKSVILENKAWNGEVGDPRNSQYLFSFLFTVDIILLLCNMFQSLILSFFVVLSAI